MPVVYRCPVRGCAFVVQANDSNHVLELARKHHDMRHNVPVSGEEVRRAMTHV
ncbi:MULTISPECIES: hypothetical protein [unclassified Haladaptatus]|uniref:hypothetical protein n=1 Tax=unclassified Haladaptatus TaxID=2622732 RepID=UPI0023E7D7EC|nr:MULTISPECIES: hypothetical protein [unclassified Haladaptatus]